MPWRSACRVNQLQRIKLQLRRITAIGIEQDIGIEEAHHHSGVGGRSHTTSDRGGEVADFCV